MTVLFVRMAMTVLYVLLQLVSNRTSGAFKSRSSQLILAHRKWKATETI